MTTVTGPVPPIDKQEAEEQLSDMCGDFEEMLRMSAHAQFVMGHAYNYAERNNLARVAGYKSTWDYFSTRVKGLTKASMARYGLETRVWDVAIKEYGIDRLRALRAYLSWNGAGQPGALDPAVKLIRVPQPDGTVVEKTFEECSLEEVQRAAARRPPKPPKPRAPVPDGVRWVYLRGSLVQHFKPTESPVRATMRYANGRVLVSVQDVPIGQVDRLIQALQEGLDSQPPALRAETPAPA